MSKLVPWAATLLALVALLLPGHGRASDADPLPIGADDAASGSPTALVTMVVFSDLECPYCAKLDDTFAKIRSQYDDQKLRIVFKHNPLPFHKGAHEKAQAAQAVLSLFGQKPFEAFIAAAFADPKLDWRAHAQAAKLAPAPIQRAIDGGKPKKKVEADMQLAQNVGVRGTPASFVNGVFISGARSESDFTTLIDGQLAEAKKLVAKGVKVAKISATLTQQNFNNPPLPPPAPPQAPADDDKVVWKVPVGASPQLGPADAPVTLVAFSEFQCPYCARVRPTLEALKTKYGSDLRIVFKNNPLPFHNRAEPAAELAMEAFKRQGHAGFWKAHDLLFDNQKHLEDQDLESYAQQLGLNPTLAMAAVKNRSYRQAIEADQELASDVEAGGTPHHFINGRRLAGAQPMEKFTALIDEELAKAKKLRAQGVAAAGLYDHVIKDGQIAPIAEKKTVAAPSAASPSLGPANAPVTIQIFTDFECPFCARAQGTLEEVRKLYGTKVRLVFRHKPLPFHTNAPMMHNAAAEAFRQKGNAAFWKMHDAIYADQKNIDRARLDDLARDLGLDMKAFAAAVDGQSHKKIIDADVKVSDDAGIRGTPGFVINGYFISGAQPVSKFKRVIDAVLKGK
jgi:protein-disulfide isomerase